MAQIRTGVGLALACTFALAVAGCGSDNNSGSSTSSGSTSSGSTSTAASGGVDLAALKQKVAPHSKAPASIGPTVPIGKPIPGGKKLVFVNCGAPACVSMQKSFEDASSTLGWTVKTIVTKPEPQGIQNAFQEAVRLKPAAVVTTGFAINQYPRQAAQLNKLKIPILSNTGTDPSTYDPSKGVTLQLQPPEEVQSATALLADQALIDAGGKGEFGTVVLTGYPSVALNVAGFTDEIKKACPDCSTKSISIAPTSLGTDAPQIIANFLRKNPKLSGLYFGYAAMAVGLPAAAKGAGVTLPKMYAWAPDGPGVQQLKDGVMTAAVPLCYVETGWQFADAAARLFTGGKVKDSQKWQPYVIWSKDYDTVPSSVNNPPCISDYADQFKKLWGVTG